MKKQIEGHASKQAPANRTTYFEILKFHIVGNDSSYDFTSLEKAMRVYNSGREIMAYIERHGFRLKKCVSMRTACDPSRECGLAPIITEKVIGVWSNKHNLITKGELDRLVKLSVETNLKEWKEVCTF